MRFKISSIIICFLTSILIIGCAYISGGSSDNDKLGSSVSDTAGEVSNIIAEESNTESTLSYDYIESEQSTTLIESIGKQDENAVSSTVNAVVSETVSATGGKKYNFTPYEEDLLLRIGMCEAGGENIECIPHVIVTVLNRVESEKFPNNIHDVLHQKKQFSPVSTKWFKNVEPTEKCKEALKLVKNGWNESKGALYFESCKGSSWHSRNLEYLFSCGTMKFYR